MKYSPIAKGCWIMKDDQVKALEQAKAEEIEMINPDKIYLHSEPVFLINEAPTAQHLSYALERAIPVIVILSKDKFSDINERMMWTHMNIPDLDFICVEWAGDHSCVPFLQNKWREVVENRHREVKAEMARAYAAATATQKKGNSEPELPPFLKNLVNTIRNRNNNGGGEEDDGPHGFFMTLGPPPKE